MSEEQKEPPRNESQLRTEPDDLVKALEEEKERSESYLARLRYAQADLENAKKRFDRQAEDLRKYCTEPLVIELLDVADELELAVKTGYSSQGSAETVVQGVEMTLKKLRKILEREGVTPIECLGQAYDPAKHHVIAQVEKEGAVPCTIIEEVRKGYVMKEKVIRPSLVKVVAQPSSSDSQMENEENE